MTLLIIVFVSSKLAARELASLEYSSLLLLTAICILYYSSFSSLKSQIKLAYMTFLLDRISFLEINLIVSVPLTV